MLVKMELLDQKHGNCLKRICSTLKCLFLVQDIVFQLQRFVSAISKYHNDCHGVLKEADVFPIEVMECSDGTTANS